MKRILLLSGIHGDERSGPKVLSSFSPQKMDSETRIDIIPIINAWGFAHNSRHNKNGLDLNRCFFDRPKKHEPKECAAIRTYAKSIRIPNDLLVSFHEDLEVSGFYLYDAGVGKTSKLIQKIMHEVKKSGVAFYTGPDDPELSKKEIKNGYIKASTKSKSPAVEDFLVRNRKAKRAITLEIPGKLPLKKRIDLARSILETILKTA